MNSKLAEIVAHKRTEIAVRKAFPAVSEVPFAAGSFVSALAGDGIKLITEIKPKSPAAGVLKEAFDVRELLEHYNRYAAAISVLTDQKYFSGSLELLAEVVRNSPHPVLCKDFILDPVQVPDARQAGAEAVLLIVKILTDVELRNLFFEIKKFGMTPVVEIQNEPELERALKLGPDVLLVNNRDLATFEISLETTKRLAKLIPPGVCTISASGIGTRAEIDSLLPYCSRFLIGTALMQSGNLSDMLRELSTPTPSAQKAPATI
ncbi:MAG: indole-3-glycerol phosphate synthase TrpC [Blastocatellia bacterium]|nr:indole-3-glycerol phosphate synthase TrpC [Blastocatellia bacterium]